MAKRMKVAFLGLGTMGRGMSRRILSAGFPLAVYNRNAERAAEIGKAGARVASTPADAAQGAEIVVSMLADDQACRAIWLGAHGALAGACKGAVLVESSTVSLKWIDELAGHAQKIGCPFLDAPVTGSKMQAANGDLNFLVGGEAQVLDSVRPVLEVMSKSITHLGRTGSGAMMKLINNFACGVQIASLAEALAMIQRSGLDEAKSMQVLSDGTPGSPMIKALATRIAAGDFRPNFSLNLMAKDLRYASAEGDSLSIPMRTAEAALEVLQSAIHKGHGDEDVAAAVKAF